MPFQRTHAETLRKTVEELPSQRNLRHQDQRLLAAADDFRDGLEIDFGLARAGDAINQRHREAAVADAAAQCVGASSMRIIAGEILPNLLPQLIVVATIEAAHAILLEAALSFLGLGVQPPLPSWGLMVADAKIYIFFAFWPIAIPGTALAILVFAINMLGDGVRDVFASGGRN